MLKYVQHVHYIVRNRDEMVAYMERNFGMKPERFVEDGGSEPHYKEAHYRVGETLVRIQEPIPGIAAYRFLEKNGPGITHIGWGVQNIVSIAQQLRDNGNTVTLHPSSQGYQQLDIARKDSFGLHFQWGEETR